MSRHEYGTYWAAEWNTTNRLDGHRSHLIHQDTVPKLFRTRAQCRSFIEADFGYIRSRPDLLAEPHGWSVPRAVRVRVQIIDAREEA